VSATHDRSAAGGRETPVAVVTGASGGIGLVLIEALLREGHHVVAASRRVEPVQALQSCAVAGRQLVCVQADLATGAGRAAVEAAVRARFGYLTSLINNAGIGMGSVRPDYHQRPIAPEEITEEILQRFFAVNAQAPIALSLRLLPLFTLGWGRIINVGTSFNAMHRPGFLPYGMSKAALESGSAILANELEGSGISVNIVNPGGPIDTPMTTGGKPSQRKDLIPPGIMADPVCWLASRASDGFSGKRITATRWQGKYTEEAVAPIGWPGLASDSTWKPSKSA
jgi:NAD(P)-dependent dehydrogenase (short-subunit alcohol dehydrogenase family)